MLVFNEGVPRAGKSYDAVKSHILPALKAGRPVFARLNGLKHDAIAEHLKMPVMRVRELLHHVETDAVVSTFAARQEGGGRWSIPPELQNALIVIDEAHEFYVQSRQPLPDDQEAFFALIGQNGGDVLIMTQWIKRVHGAIRARIERKHVFQKLTAVGAKKKYRVTHYHTIGPDKFEKIGGSTEVYDPAIFPLYDGYAPGAHNVEVYEAGGTNVWKSMLPKIFMFGTAALIGAFFLLRFFTSGGDGLVDSEKNYIGATAPAMGGIYQPGAGPSAPAEVAQVTETIKQKQEREREEALSMLTPEQRYVVELSQRGRLRLAVKAGLGAGVYRMIFEWLDGEGMPQERLSGESLQAMGFVVTATEYGAQLVAKSQTIVATQWPMPPVVIRESESRLYNLSRDSEGVAAPSTPSEASRGGTGPSGDPSKESRAPRYGQFRNEEQGPASYEVSSW